MWTLHLGLHLMILVVASRVPTEDSRECLFRPGPGASDRRLGTTNKTMCHLHHPVVRLRVSLNHQPSHYIGILFTSTDCMRNNMTPDAYRGLLDFTSWWLNFAWLCCANDWSGGGSFFTLLWLWEDVGYST